MRGIQDISSQLSALVDRPTIYCSAIVMKWNIAKVKPQRFHATKSARVSLDLLVSSIIIKVGFLDVMETVVTRSFWAAQKYKYNPRNLPSIGVDKKTTPRKSLFPFSAGKTFEITPE